MDFRYLQTRCRLFKKAFALSRSLLHDKSYLGFQMCMFELSDEELYLIETAFKSMELFRRLASMTNFSSLTV